MTTQSPVDFSLRELGDVAALWRADIAKRQAQLDAYQASRNQINQQSVQHLPADDSEGGAL